MDIVTIYVKSTFYYNKININILYTKLSIYVLKHGQIVVKMNIYTNIYKYENYKLSAPREYMTKVCIMYIYKLCYK